MALVISMKSPDLILLMDLVRGGGDKRWESNKDLLKPQWKCRPGCFRVSLVLTDSLPSNNREVP